MDRSCCGACLALARTEMRACCCLKETHCSEGPAQEAELKKATFFMSQCMHCISVHVLVCIYNTEHNAIIQQINLHVCLNNWTNTTNILMVRNFQRYCSKIFIVLNWSAEGALMSIPLNRYKSAQTGGVHLLWALQIWNKFRTPKGRTVNIVLRWRWEWNKDVWCSLYFSTWK